jgi:hypothetical protein
MISVALSGTVTFIDRAVTVSWVRVEVPAVVVGAVIVDVVIVIGLLLGLNTCSG